MDNGRARVGAFTLTALLDGVFPCDATIVKGAASKRGEELFLAGGLPPAGPSMEPVNAFLVERGGKSWLIDAGFGAVPGFGKVAQGMASSDRRLEAVIVTHLHQDHVGGLVKDGGRAFPATRLVVPEAEVRFWTDPSSPANSREPAENFALARRVLELYAGDVDVVSSDEPITEGLRFRPLPGHTPGHSGVMVEDGGDRLLMWTDTIHSALLQLGEPAWSVDFDNDPDLAVSTRIALLGELADSPVRIAGSHVTGTGRLTRRAGGFGFARDDRADRGGPPVHDAGTAPASSGTALAQAAPEAG